ncbi:LDL receptor repeat-containing protein egg-2-like [Bolinopsis microptera]|uniref:LDL receptor repeat-containing protein egg-2-like n=1 Tax=Bolinopsis microptera TaxID=2820187 RepID=UPI003079E4C3
MNICIATSSCLAAVISPKLLDVTSCYAIGEYTLSDDNAYAWYTAERRCLETKTPTNTSTNPDPNPGFTLRNKNGLERRLPQRVPKNIGTACEEGYWKCSDGEKCIDERFVCSGVTKCYDGSDQTDCSERECQGNQMEKCADGEQCIDAGWVCTGFTQCYDGSDQTDCSG